MATVYGDINGNIIGIAKNLVELANVFPSVPSGTVTVLDFDEVANSALFSDLLANEILYTLVAGPLLKKSGVTQTITGSTISSTTWRNAIATANGISPATIIAAVSVLLAGTATNAQQQTAIAYLIIKLATAGLLF